MTSHFYVWADGQAVVDAVPELIDHVTGVLRENRAENSPLSFGYYLLIDRDGQVLTEYWAWTESEPDKRPADFLTEHLTPEMKPYGLVHGVNSYLDGGARNYCANVHGVFLSGNWFREHRWDRPDDVPEEWKNHHNLGFPVNTVGLGVLLGRAVGA